MLADNLRVVRETIASALAKRSEKKETGDTVCLVAVTKNHPADVVTEIEALGVGNVGENRVQEAREKQQQIGHPGKWHLIGHLQTNKAKQAVEFFDLIESADSEHLLILSGTGEVIDPDEGIAAIGSGGNYALAAARALLQNTELSAAEIAEKALRIAASICVFTNDHIIVETL